MLHLNFGKMNNKPDEIFLITDGLPTIGEKNISNSFFIIVNLLLEMKKNKRKL